MKPRTAIAPSPFRRIPMRNGALGFDPERLARVRHAVLSDIEHGRCHGVAMRVARHGTTVLDLCEGYADRRCRHVSAGGFRLRIHVGCQTVHQRTRADTGRTRAPQAAMRRLPR